MTPAGSTAHSASSSPEAIAGKQSSHWQRGEALCLCAPVEELPSQVCVAEAADLIVRARTDLSPRATRDLATTGRNLS